MQKSNTHNVVSSVKLFLVSGALTGTVWLWSMFANKAIQDMAKKNLASATANNQPPPTNVPVVAQPVATQVPTNALAPTPTLRVVNVPKGGAVVQVIPIVVMSSGNTSSGGSVSNPAPVTSTGSSKP